MSKRIVYFSSAASAMIAEMWWMSWIFSISAPFKWWGFPLAMTGAVICTCTAVFLVLKARK